MKLLLIFSNILFSIFLVMSGVTFVLNKTASSDYLTAAAEKSNIYKGVSEIVRSELAATSARSLGLPQEATTPLVDNVVTDEYIKTKSGEINEQIEQILRGERNKLSIEFSDLIAQAETAGLQLNSTDIKPVEIELPQSSRESIRSAQSLELLQFISYGLTVLFGIASVVISIIRRSTLGLGVALSMSGIAFACLALLSKLLEVTATNLISLPENLRELDSYADTFIKTIISDMSSQYILFALISAGVALICFIIHKVLKPYRAQNHPLQPPAHQLRVK